MRTWLINTWQILKQTFSDFMDDKVLRMSAALAYYTIFSIAPMLIVIITLCDIFYGRKAIEGSIYVQIKGFVGSDAAAQIQEIIRNASLSKGSIAKIVGVIALIFGATSVFAEIQDSINYIWRLKAKPKQGLVKMLLTRVLSFSILISMGFILLVSLILNAIMAALSDKFALLFPNLQFAFAYILNLGLTFVITAILFGVIFKILPDARIRWKDIRIGAITTALLFMLGKYAIGFYLGTSHVGTTYGAAGSIVIVLLWVYYSAIILYFGAEFTRVYAQHSGWEIYPNEYAVWIRQVEVESKDQSLKEEAQVEEKIAQKAEEFSLSADAEIEKEASQKS